MPRAAAATPRSVDLSVVLCLHREGSLLAPTLRSLTEAIFFAEAQGISTELVIVLDDADAETRAHLAQAAILRLVPARRTDVRCHSLGLARNAGVAAATGELVCFADGDDLVSFDFFAALYAAARAAGPNAIAMPQWLLLFGERLALQLLLPLDEIGPLNLLTSNPFASRICASKALLTRLPFADASAETGYAFEDWRHHCDAVAAGCVLTTAPGAMLFYRQREGSLSRAAGETAPGVTSPSNLFAPAMFLERCAADQARFAKQRQIWLAGAPPKSALLRVPGREPASRSKLAAAAALEPALASALADCPAFFTAASHEHKAAGAFYFELCQALIGAAPVERICVAGSTVAAQEWLGPSETERNTLLLAHDLRQGMVFAAHRDSSTRAPTEFPALHAPDRACAERLFVRIADSLAPYAELHLAEDRFAREFGQRYSRLLGPTRMRIG